ncbi:hypothetical protein ACR3K2_18430 [Cryptosporidium serpentis]
MFTIIRCMIIIYITSSLFYYLSYAFKTSIDSYNKSYEATFNKLIIEDQSSDNKNKFQLYLCSICGCKSHLGPIEDDNNKRYVCLYCENSNDLQNCIFSAIQEEWYTSLQLRNTSLYNNLLNYYKGVAFGNSQLYSIYPDKNILNRNIDLSKFFMWEILTPGNMTDNCVIINDKYGNPNSFNMRYTLIVKKGHLAKDINVSFYIDGNNKVYEDIIQFDNQYINQSDSINVYSFKYIKLPIEKIYSEHNDKLYSMSKYSIPPKHVFDFASNSWIPIGSKILQEGIHIEHILNNIQMSLNCPKDSSCDLRDLNVFLSVDCQPTIGSPEYSFTINSTIEKIADIYRYYRDKPRIFGSFLNRLKYTLTSKLQCIPNAFYYQSTDTPIRTPFENLSPACKEAIYFSELPKIGHMYDFDMNIAGTDNPDKYIVKIEHEDVDDGLLAEKIHKIFVGID